MSQAALGLGFGERRQPALGRSFVLAFLMHAVLLGVMFIGVRWQSHEPETVSVELWEAPAPVPPAPPPPVPKVEAPKPQPAPPPPPVLKPEPRVEKPDIAIREKPKPKPKPKPEPKAEPPKRDLEFEKRLREQAATEQRALEEQQRVLEAQRRERELRELLERQQAAAQAAARASALATWTGKIRAKIRGNIPVSVVDEVQGNPEAIFDVTLLPTGEVLSVTRRKSSGHRGYDEAVERAILKSSPLPKPDDPGLFQRRLELRFQPQDK
jgi:colicin import membrane protein